VSLKIASEDATNQDKRTLRKISKALICVQVEGARPDKVWDRVFNVRLSGFLQGCKQLVTIDFVGSVSIKQPTMNLMLFAHHPYLHWCWLFVYFHRSLAGQVLQQRPFSSVTHQPAHIKANQAKGPTSKASTAATFY
jgi:hypothetical protein